MVFLNDVLQIDDLTQIVFKMCNPVILVRNDLIDFDTLIDICRVYPVYFKFSKLIPTIIVKWHSHFTPTIIDEFYQKIFVTDIEELVESYLISQLTISSIQEFSKRRRDSIISELIAYNLHKDVDKCLEIIKHTKEFTELHKVYLYYPTPEMVYRIFDMLLSLNKSDYIVDEYIEKMQYVITPEIEDLFRKHNKHHRLHCVLNDVWDKKEKRLPRSLPNSDIDDGDSD
jgi:hypothetical protein